MTGVWKTIGGLEINRDKLIITLRKSLKNREAPTEVIWPQV